MCAARTGCAPPFIIASNGAGARLTLDREGEDSFNRSALDAALQLAPEGAEIEIFALTEALPEFNQDERQEAQAG